MKKTLLCFFLLVWFPTVGWASEAYEYANAAVDAFIMVKDAATATPHKLNSKAGSMDVVSSLMKTSVSQSHAFKMAGINVKPFTKSNDKEIQETATDLEAVFLMLETSSEQTTTLCEKLLNNPRGAADSMGTATRGLYELQEQVKSNWDVYAKVASGAISLPLTNSERLVNGRLHYLKITQAEREQLKAKLLRAFGPSVKTVGITTPIYQAPAGMLWRLLNSRWEPADSNQ